MRKHGLILLLMLFSICAMAQKVTINAKVIDKANKEPLIGATVIEMGTSNGTITDFDGNFTLEVGTGAIIQVSYVGYKTLEEKANSNIKLVSLESDSETLDEVVVVGYGTMRKKDLSGAVSSLGADQLTKGSNGDLSQSLTGKLAGVKVSQNDAAPGSGMSINVRGSNSFSTSSQPLYVIDGIPYVGSSAPSGDANKGSMSNDNPLSMLNPNDIESIDVLKDASATAIYGSRGANGVVLVTTKKGAQGKGKIEFSSSVSISQIAKTAELLDAYNYANFINEQVDNSNFYDGQSLKPTFTGTWDDYGVYKPKPEDFLNPGTYTDPTGTYNHIVSSTDWQDVILQNAFNQEYNLRFSGGGDSGTYAVSGSYLSQEGIVKNSGFNRFAIRSNVTQNVKSWLRLGSNISYTNTVNNLAKTNTNSSSILRSALIFPPTYDPLVKNEQVDDEFSWLAGNPYAFVNNAKDELTTNNIFTSSFLEIKILKELKFRQNVGLAYTTRRRQSYYGRDTKEGGEGRNGLAGQSDNWNQNYTLESLLTYNKSFNKRKHQVNALAGFTAEHATYGSKSMSATNFPNDMTQDFNMGAGLLPGVLISNYGDNSLISLIFRGNYTLLDKYLFTATYRRDGSSKFIEANKYADFFSGAIAWRLSEERFIKDLNVFDNLKLRASFGETGNQGINSYATFTPLGTANFPFGGAGNESGSAITGNLVSSDLRWETTQQFDAGIDIAVLNNKVSLNIDYYYKKTRDLLQTVAIPNSTGYQYKLINSGNVTNKGLELTLGLNDILRDTPVRLSLNGNMSFNRNTISGLGKDQFAQRLFAGVENVFIQRDGMPIGAIYGYVENGFYDNIAEVKADPQYKGISDTEALKKVGEVKYQDIDGKPGITADDMTIIGNTNPDFTYSFTPTIGWKWFTLDLFFQGSYGNDIFNANLLDVNLSKSRNVPVEVYNTRWTPDNTANAKWPKPTSETTRKMLVSNRYVEDGSFFKLKNVHLDFRYPFKKNKAGIDVLTIFFNATNLFTVTDYSGFDPEINSFGTDASRQGVDYYAYPSSRTYTLGFRLGF